MNVKEMAEWLLSLPDQNAIIEVVVHKYGSSYYDQGGNAHTEVFDLSENNFEITLGYTFRGVEYPSSILLGVYNA